MRLSTSALLLSAAWSALARPEHPSFRASSPILPRDDVSSAFSARPVGPKKSYRLPDSHWDHVVKGAEMHIEAEGKQASAELANYNLRANKMDPSKLGVDKVKQYSGYLDDEAQDKHLFYCKFAWSLRMWIEYRC